MNRLLICLSLALACAFADPVKESNKDPKIWALLVAGSNGYYNYRHQADICHAYQILSAHGIPDERIVVMMYDDIANSASNPIKGNIINKPNGENVYPGVPKDYTGKEVTPANFMKILQGQKPTGGSGKVINSTKDDNVFVYFSDHGAVGLVAFPRGSLTKKQLWSTLDAKAAKKDFNQMVLYIEACESGSMMEKYPANKNIFATTASNAHESSYAYYYDSKRRTYLGDEYSVKWMEDSDAEDLTAETLTAQFDLVKKQTKESHVMEYGDLTMGKLHVSLFQGAQQAKKNEGVKPVEGDRIDSRDVVMDLMRREINSAKTLEFQTAAINKYNTAIKMRAEMGKLFELIARKASKDSEQETRVLADKHDLVDIDCHHDVVQHFTEHCFDIGMAPYSTRYVYTIVNMCEEKIELATITKAIDEACVDISDEMKSLQ